MSTAEWAVTAFVWFISCVMYAFVVAMVHEGGKRDRARLHLLSPVWPLVALWALHNAIHRLWADALSDDHEEPMS